ncbi:MAG: hypothetical protein WCQ69_10120 [Bacteroidales bacterium]|jgi:hypothetical protein|nr:hypothetical protein [Bacteroidales bacterium]HHV40121.1 hypothetical protein [Bacteroidales bacterium]
MDVFTVIWNSIVAGFKNMSGMDYVFTFMGLGALLAAIIAGIVAFLTPEGDA